MAAGKVESTARDLREVLVEQSLVAAECARKRGRRTSLRLADERVNDESVDDLERRLQQILVGAVNGIARLKRDGAPSTLGLR